MASASQGAAGGGPGVLAPPLPADDDRREILDRLLVRLLKIVSQDERGQRIARAANPEAAAAELAAMGERAMEHLELPEGFFLTKGCRQQLLIMLDHEVLGFGPIHELLQDPAVEEIMVNGPDRIFVERHGRIESSGVKFRDRDHLFNLIQRIVWRLGRRIDESSPLVDARLSDGSRVHAAIAPVALKGPYLTIRKFAASALTLDGLVRRRSLTPEMAEFVRGAVAARLNIIVSGGTGSGKTTFLNVLASLTSPEERIITIEDAAELQMGDHENVCAFEARPSNVEGRGAITIRDLIRNSLRMRPDRLIVGEVRGAEALDMLQAMNTGHEGSFTTVHANSAQDLFSRLETMVCMGATELPIPAIRDIIASAVHLVVQVARQPDGSRQVVEIAEVCGVGEDGRVAVNPIWTYEVVGYGVDGKVERAFRWHGVPLRTRERFESHGNRWGATTATHTAGPEGEVVNSFLDRLQRDL